MSEAKIIWRTNPDGVRTWTYGYWGGGGWSNGQFTPADQTIDPNGDVADPLDNQFKRHDIDYQEALDTWKASDQTLTDIHTFWDAIIAADRAMLDGIDQLRRDGALGEPPGLGQVSEAYIAAAQATAAFGALMIPANQAARESNLSPERLGDVGSLTGNHWDHFWEGVERGNLDRLLQWSVDLDEIIKNVFPDIESAAWGQFWERLEREVLDRLLGLSSNLDEMLRVVRDQTQTASTIRSPIILDLDGTGINTVGLDAGVYFDHAADGFAERTGWLGSGDGLLVWDRDGNGVIDSGRELFGSETMHANGLKAVNGFEALAELDINGDGVIDANDPAFAELRVWVDANVDGRTGEGELLTLQEAGVQAIHVGYTTSGYVDTNGNEHRQRGSFVTTDGETRTATDVWFQTDAAYSIPTEWVEVPEAIALLPDARGYGTARNLHQAMAMDTSGTLEEMVSAFVAADTPEDREALLTSIIYHWAGVQDIDPYSRASRMIYGNAIGDARRLEALEVFLGSKWVGIWCWNTPDPNPHGRAAPVLLKAWDDLKALVYGQLMVQSSLKDLFLEIRYGWNDETESVVGDLSDVAAALGEAVEADRYAGLEQLSEFLRSVRGLGLAGSLDITGFRALLAPVGEDVVQVFEAALSGWVDSNTASEGNDVLRGSEFDDVIDGRGGNDIILGRGGNDTLIGGAGNDTLDGGAGNDELRGGPGNDTYRFGRGDGHDTIVESSWSADDVDRIELKAGVAPSDVRLERVRDPNNWWNVDDLVLTIVDTGETIMVKKHFSAGHRHAIEEIVFADGTVWAEDEIRAAVLIGGDGDDELRGFAGRDNFISGAAGNDTLIGSGGNDTLLGGEGDDLLEGGSGDDVLVAGPGSDTLRGGSGSDTYRFGLGDGFNVIEEGHDPTSVDTIDLAEGIAPEDVTVRFTRGAEMLVSLPDGTSILVRYQASSSAAGSGLGIEQLRFADGTLWDRDALARRAVAGTDGDDMIVAGPGDDTIDGGAGNDTLVNLGGYNTYLFGIGDGQDTIEGGRGKIVFKEGIDQLGVRFERDGSALIATIEASGDAIRIRNWTDTWSRIDRFDYSNGASLSATEVTALLGVGGDSEILYGSPGDDLITGSHKNSTLHGRAGNDTLIGGGGSNRLYGEAGDDILVGGSGSDTLYGGEGNDTLNGGAGRDVLYGGHGNNVYTMERGSGLDQVYASTAMVADDTVVFGPGVRLEDVTVQMGARSGGVVQPGDVGYAEMVVGFGGDDALIIRHESWSDIGRAAVRRFRFEDGSELSLEEMVARADGGVMGWQWRDQGDPALVVGSAADDSIEDYTGESVIVRAGANDDYVYLAGGDNIVLAGSGNDTVYAGSGDDVIAGETGDDVIDGGEGDDTFLFNYGDGHDRLTAGDGVDTLSFGGGITPETLGAYVAPNGRLVLSIDGGAGGSVTLSGVILAELPGDLQRVQFIDAEGHARVFDFAAWVSAHAIALVAATAEASAAFTAESFELTGKVAPAGGLEAVAYAQTGDVFGAATLAHNAPGEGDDVIYGTPDVDVIDAGAGNDIVMGLAGDDTIFGGEGDDLLYGGDGDDMLDGGPGNDTLYGGHGADTLRGGPGRDELYGGWGGDTYVYHPGDEEVVIDDDHRAKNWWHEGGMQPSAAGSESLAYSALEWDHGGVIIDDAPNILQFGEGIRPEDLRYSEHDGDLVIDFAGRPGDRVILRGYAPHRATQTRSVDVFRFADGTEIVAETIEASGVIEHGGDNGAWLEGTAFADTLVGGDGDDYFRSSGGSDLLVGGKGSDTYRIYREWGAPAAHVTLVEVWREEDFNRLELTGDVDADDLHLVFDGRDLVLMLGGDGGSVRFAGFDPREPGMQAPVAEIALPWQGQVLSFDDLVARGIRYGDHTQDVYDVKIGDGEITVVDVAAADAGNAVRFGPGIELEALHDRLSFAEDGAGGHWLLIHYGGEGDVLRLSGFNRDNVLGGGHAVENFVFTDGTVVDYATLVSWGFTVEGDEADDTVHGSNLDDRLHGHDGDDVLIGGEGNDVLFGGRGNDTLIGGAGDDAYVFAPGDGVDTIIDSGDEDFNYVRFVGGILPEDVSQEWDGATLLLHYGDGDTVRIENLFSESTDNPAVLVMVFEDGTVVPLLERLNRTPTANGELSSAVAERGETFSYSIPEGFFEDPDLNDHLRLNARLMDGSALPAWLAFDPETGRFFGTPAVTDVGTLGVVVEATDHFGLTVERSFVLDVELKNEAPVVNVVLEGFEAARNAAFSFALPADTFVDADPDDELALSATLSDGSPLPEWLSFDTAAGTFSGIPPALGEHVIRVTATDLAGASISQTFVLRVEGEDDYHAGPVTALDAATVTEDRTLRAWGNVLANDSHPESTVLSVADSGVRRGEYGWLKLLCNGGYAYVLDNFSTKVQGLGAGETGEERFGYLATDGEISAPGELTITVHGVNDTPDLARPLSDVQLGRGKAFSLQVPDGSFIDRDRNDVLSYSATLKNGEPLPDWLAFDTETRTFSGTAPAKAKGKLDVTVIATDGHGEDSTASDTFKITFGRNTGVAKGNAGVGNGIDSPPPGHAFDHNDGAGTSPGHPGSKLNGRGHDSLANFLDGFKLGGKGSGSALPGLERGWFERWLEQQAGQSEHASMTDRPAADAIERHWSQLMRSLDKLDAGRRGAPGWSDPARGADLAGFAGAMHSGIPAVGRGDADGLPMVVGGAQLASFAGLRTGLDQLRY